MGVPFSSKVEFYYGIWKSEERKCDVFSNFNSSVWTPMVFRVLLQSCSRLCPVEFLTLLLRNNCEWLTVHAAARMLISELWSSFVRALMFMLTFSGKASVLSCHCWHVKYDNFFFRWQSRLSSVLFRFDGSYTAILLDSSTIDMHTDNVTWNNIRMWKYFPGVQIVFP